MKINDGQLDHAQLDDVTTAQHHMRPVDLVVDAAGGGDHATVDAAIDAIDGPGTIWVKGGSYAGFTLDEASLAVLCEPDCTFTSAVVMSGQEASITSLGDMEIQGAFTMSGAGCTFQGFGATGTQGVIMSGAYSSFFGSGIGDSNNGAAARHGIAISATGCTVENTRAETTAGGGTSYDAINISASDAKVRFVEVADSDQYGLSITGGQRAMIESVYVRNSDDHGFYLAAGKNILQGCIAQSAGGDGFHFTADGDNNIVTASQVQDAGSQTMELVSGADNNVVGLCRLGGAITDSGSGNTLTGNNTSGL